MGKAGRCGGSGEVPFKSPAYRVFGGEGADAVLGTAPCPACPDCKPCPHCSGNGCPRCERTGIDPKVLLGLFETALTEEAHGE